MTHGSPHSVTGPDAQRLVEILASVPDRLTAAEIAARMFGTRSETLERRVRVIASAAQPRVVSFPGTDSFALWERCTTEEIEGVIRALEQHGKDMIRDANLYRAANQIRKPPQ